MYDLTREVGMDQLDKASKRAWWLLAFLNLCLLLECGVLFRSSLRAEREVLRLKHELQGCNADAEVYARAVDRSAGAVARTEVATQSIVQDVTNLRRHYDRCEQDFLACDRLVRQITAPMLRRHQRHQRLWRRAPAVPSHLSSL